MKDDLKALLALPEISDYVRKIKTGILLMM